MPSRLRSLLLPLLLSLYPVVHLYGLNAEHVTVDSLTTPVAASLAGLAILWFLFFILAGAWERASLAVSLLYVASFAYTGLEGRLLDTPSATSEIGHALLMVFSIAAIAVIVRRLKDVAPWASALSVGIAVMYVVPLARSVQAYRQSSAVSVVRPHSKVPAKAVDTQPDVYDIILDGYAREDVLKSYFQYDNQAFIDALRRRGFYVASRASSNYAYTLLSLSSSLNGMYLDKLSESPEQMTSCLDLLRNNRFMRRLKETGYRIIHFSSGWFSDDNPNADVVVNARPLDELMMLSARSSPLRWFLRRQEFNGFRRRTLQILTSLGDNDRFAGPTYFFCHILSPHPPFVFDRKGDFPPALAAGKRPEGARDWFPKERYVDQLVYLSGEVLKTVERVQQRAKRPYIILLHSDHGPACDGTSAHPTAQMVHERMGILLAVYAPGIQKDFYETMTPVNAYRLLSNHLFDEKAPLFPDRNFYSGPMDALPYRFNDVTALVRSSDDRSPRP